MSAPTKAPANLFANSAVDEPVEQGRRREQLPWGSPLTYLAALLAVAFTMGPVAYQRLVLSRDTAGAIR